MTTVYFFFPSTATNKLFSSLLFSTNENLHRFILSLSLSLLVDLSQREVIKRKRKCSYAHIHSWARHTSYHHSRLHRKEKQFWLVLWLYHVIKIITEEAVRYTSSDFIAINTGNTFRSIDCPWNYYWHLLHHHQHFLIIRQVSQSLLIYFPFDIVYNNKNLLFI